MSQRIKMGKEQDSFATDYSFKEVKFSRVILYFEVTKLLSWETDFLSNGFPELTLILEVEVLNFPENKFKVPLFLHKSTSHMEFLPMPKDLLTVTL